MNITLNLLPENRKRKIRNGKILKLFIYLEGMLIFAIIFLFGIVLGMNEIVNLRVQSVEGQISTGSSAKSYAEIKKYEDYLDKIRTDIGIINKVQKNDINWVSVFKEISNNISDGVLVSSISNDEYRITMTGVANNRDQLVEMKSKIEQNECFKNISIPINDIVLKDNIDFEMSFDVEKKCLIYEEE